MLEDVKMLNFLSNSIIVLFQVVTQFSNFLNLAEKDEKRLVGLRLAAPQAKIREKVAP